MTEKIQLKVIEVEANKLIPGAKYIFTISPQWGADLADYILPELDRLIGADNYTVLVMPKDDLSIHAIAEDN